MKLEAKLAKFGKRWNSSNARYRGKILSKVELRRSPYSKWDSFNIETQILLAVAADVLK
ncbi:hypothetical protein KKB83_04000 [Patescibacteria group bacterium]|nr:hypothetical protein [Patescibacteria group bacterium]